MKTDKLAEEIITRVTGKSSWYLKQNFITYYQTIKAMQEYHKAKMSEITDEDIEKWADTQCLIEPMRGYSKASMVSAAKAMRNGEIKPAKE